MAQPSPGPTTGTNATTGAAPAGGHGAVFPPFQSSTFAGQIIWFAITFGLLYYVMSRIALPRVGALMHERQVRLAADLEAAQKAKAESDAAAVAHEKALADARKNAEGIALETRAKLGAEADAKRKQLEAELAERLAASEATIRARTAEAMGNVRDIAADTASAIIERLTAQAPDRAAIDAALDRTLTR